MSKCKFGVAQFQRIKTMTQKVKNSEYQSKYKFFKTKENMTTDIFEKTKNIEKECSSKSIMDILTRKTK